MNNSSNYMTEMLSSIKVHRKLLIGTSILLSISYFMYIWLFPQYTVKIVVNNGTYGFDDENAAIKLISVATLKDRLAKGVYDNDLLSSFGSNNTSDLPKLQITPSKGENWFAIEASNNEYEQTTIFLNNFVILLKKEYALKAALGKQELIAELNTLELELNKVEIEISKLKYAANTIRLELETVAARIQHTNTKISNLKIEIAKLIIGQEKLGTDIAATTIKSNHIDTEIEKLKHKITTGANKATLNNQIIEIYKADLKKLQGSQYHPSDATDSIGAMVPGDHDQHEKMLLANIIQNNVEYQQVALENYYDKLLLKHDKTAALSNREYRVQIINDIEIKALQSRIAELKLRKRNVLIVLRKLAIKKESSLVNQIMSLENKILIQKLYRDSTLEKQKEAVKIKISGLEVVDKAKLKLQTNNLKNKIMQMEFRLTQVKNIDILIPCEVTKGSLTTALVKSLMLFVICINLLVVGLALKTKRDFDLPGAS